MRVHDSQAYTKMDVTRERISCILELREILLSFQDWTQYDDKIVVSQIRLFSLFFFFFFVFNDAMIAAVCSKTKRFNESGSSMYIFVGDFSSQTEVCLNNGNR